MLYALGELLQDHVGPFRLLTSRLLLGSLGLVACAVLAFWLLPRLAPRLPKDRGRAHAVDSASAVGKPTGAGVVFVTVFLLVQVLVMPPSLQVAGILVLALVEMVAGWLDDRSVVSWGEYKKATIDLVVCVAAAATVCGMEPYQMWVPFSTASFELPVHAFLPIGTVVLWTAINATNCTDGVDGLSGTLSAIALTGLGALLYFVLGHREVAHYLLLPHHLDGATWGLLAFSLVGTLVGYLWWNAHPSVLLMGDAGSRPIGFLLGVLVLATGNPFTLIIVSAVLLANGGTGLIKVALLRFARIAILRSIRFPLHDHVRRNMGWSNAQVLVRFAIVQLILTLSLMTLLVKVR